MPNRNAGGNKRKFNHSKTPQQGQAKKTFNEVAGEESKHRPKLPKNALREIMKEQTQLTHIQVEEYKTELKGSKEKIMRLDIEKLKREVETKNRVIREYMKVRETSDQVIKIHRELAIKQDELISCKDKRCQLQEKVIRKDKIIIDALQEKFKEINNMCIIFLNKDDSI